MSRRFFPARLAGALAAAYLAVVSLPSSGQDSTSSGAACLDSGEWAVPASPAPRRTSAMDALASARSAQVVLLGENHDDADHHRWQLHTLGMLLATRGRLVIGMEMLPRSAQPVLDRWVAGEVGESELLRQTQWNKVWGYDADLYLPILHFARLHRLPLIALNVDRSLIRDVGAKGLAAVPADRREGVSDPAPATPAYRTLLRRWFEQHPNGADAEDPGAFDRFVEAQLLWDRAFAEALVQSSKRQPDALVVGIIGSGHLRNAHGVPYQLNALGVQQVRVWLPISARTPCAEIEAGLADAVFAIEGGKAATTPRLGVLLDDEQDGPRVREVMAGSVAEHAGVKPGDRLLAAAGIRLASAADLISALKKQPPGTWLPLRVERSGNELDLVAKFPAAAE